MLLLVRVVHSTPAASVAGLRGGAWMELAAVPGVEAQCCSVSLVAIRLFDVVLETLQGSGYSVSRTNSHA